MAAEILLALLRANIAASLAILAVLLLRGPARRLFGAQAAYALWLTAPAAMIGALFALTAKAAPGGPARALNRSAKLWLSGQGHAAGLMALWTIGVLAGLAFVIWSQQRFLKAAEAGRAGPAVAGVINPRLVVPADFDQRFTPEERRLIRAHERAHIDRRDARTNALAVMIQCVGWFNPVLHLAARALRLDQELACDAAVVDRLPRSRRRYAETLLRTQLADMARPPLGCHWAARGVHPLEARIGMLTRPSPPQARQDFGLFLLVLLGMAAGLAAWAVQPAQPPWLPLLITLPMTLLLDLG
jgi:beta-lactamase regulating signal transducer with metallopeptidase domain